MIIIFVAPYCLWLDDETFHLAGGNADEFYDFRNVCFQENPFIISEISALKLDMKFAYCWRQHVKVAPLTIYKSRQAICNMNFLLSEISM